MAKKFKYRFAPMLKVKEHREKERQRELAEAIGRVVEQKARLKHLDTARSRTVERQRDRLVGTISVAEALVCSRYLVRLKRDRMAGGELLRGLERQTEHKRLALVEAARERKIYDMLRDKQQLRHRQQIEKDEQKALDEVATVGFRRKHKGR
jgi:flagellar protein FliJ